MSAFTRIESDMDFLLDTESAILPEQSEPYLTLVHGNGIKTCDFVVVRNSVNVYLIEAKSSAPNPANVLTVADVKEFLAGIHSKMTDTLLLLIGMRIGRDYKNIAYKMGTGFEMMDLSSVSITPLLIIKDFKREWLPEISDLLRKKLKSTRKAFMLEDIMVLNGEQARTNGFIR